MEAAKKIPLVVVAGPTASGKTEAAIRICQWFNGEVVSADSMQIYKYLSVGTAKPDEAEKEEIPHHLMDFLEPSQPFSVAEYVEMAKEKIADIHSRGKLPVIVGGTGLYIDSLVKLDGGDYRFAYHHITPVEGQNKEDVTRAYPLLTLRTRLLRLGLGRLTGLCLTCYHIYRYRT